MSSDEIYHRFCFFGILLIFITLSCHGKKTNQKSIEDQLLDYSNRLISVLPHEAKCHAVLYNLVRECTGFAKVPKKHMKKESDLKKSARKSIKNTRRRHKQRSSKPAKHASNEVGANVKDSTIKAKSHGIRKNFGKDMNKYERYVENYFPSVAIDN